MECTMNMCERVRIFIKKKGRAAIFELQHIVYLLHYGSLVIFLQTCESELLPSVLSGSLL